VGHRLVHLGAASLITLGCLTATATSAFGQTSPRAIAAALGRGGYVLVMRHANSPQLVAQEDVTNPESPTRERRLDEIGRREATAMGTALRALRIPVASVTTSPAYRAVETAECLRVGPSRTMVELSDGGMNSSGVTEAQIAWLRARLSEKPPTGNVLLITHQPNFARAFPEWGNSVAQGEVAVFRPDGRGGSTFVGRIRIQDWPSLTPRRRP
jgi:phosphohistidine phosphatase SixA